MKSMRRIIKVGVLLGLVAIVTGCCVAPFGYGHQRGYERGYGDRYEAPAPSRHQPGYR